MFHLFHLRWFTNVEKVMGMQRCQEICIYFTSTETSSYFRYVTEKQFLVEYFHRRSDHLKYKAIIWYILFLLWQFVKMIGAMTLVVTIASCKGAAFLARFSTCFSIWLAWREKNQQLQNVQFPVQQSKFAIYKPPMENEIRPHIWNETRVRADLPLKSPFSRTWRPTQGEKNGRHKIHVSDFQQNPCLFWFVTRRTGDARTITLNCNISCILRVSLKIVTLDQFQRSAWQ